MDAGLPATSSTKRISSTTFCNYSPFMDKRKQFANKALITTLGLSIGMMAVIYFALSAVAAEIAIFGGGLILGLVMWVAVRSLGSQYIVEAKPQPAELPKPKPQPAPAPKAVAPPPPPPPPSDAPAVQILSILQRKGRLLDFLQEDLSAYQDDQIGAAVRSVHEGCKKALDEYVDLEPIYQDAEGSQVTLNRGFDTNAVRLIGDVAGDPPFRGELRHRGWRVAKMKLPERIKGADSKIVAAAEVEVR